ncbi:unnamed protein product, partial [Oppiella nova]
GQFSCNTSSSTIIAPVLQPKFIAFPSGHLTRRSLSIAKPALNHANCTELLSDSVNFTELQITGYNEYWCDWEPFKGGHARTLLGTLDLVFLISYSVSMYINGWIAERMNLRYFLIIGMLFAGLCNVLFGLAYYLDIHSLAYFYVIQVLTGIGQSTGWPGVLGTVGHWFGPSKRGLIFGIWNSHLNFGNIAGAAVAGLFVDDQWGLCFIVPGVIIAAMSLLVFLFLVQKPEEVGLSLSSDTEHTEQTPVKNNDMNRNIKQIQFKDETQQHKAISILDAIKIPGVIEFSICLFFAKLVSYTFLDWLPLYISQTNPDISTSKSAYMTIFFDLGGILGGITAGYMADKTGASALSCIFMLIFAIPSVSIKTTLANHSKLINKLPMKAYNL